MLRVVDGDTLLVSVNGEENRVRLYGIDAPERGQPYFDDAKEYLESIVNERVDMYKMDRKKSYRRTIAIVYGGLNREESLNLQMLRAGYAFYVPYSGRLNGAKKAVREARRERRGMWASESQIQKPWDYRQDLKAKSETELTLQDPKPTFPDEQTTRSRNTNVRNQRPTRQGRDRSKFEKLTKSDIPCRVAFAITMLWLIAAFLSAIFTN